MSATKKGNYYKKKTKLYYELLGYTVQLTEFTCGMVIKGRAIYRKIDIFGADGIAMNGKEIIFWNSKATEIGSKGLSWHKSTGKTEFEKYPFPASVKRQLVLWEPRKKPVIVELA